MARRTIEHYEILRRLGAGGSGVVYLANDTLLQRPVVLKILRTGLLSAEQMRTTVLREARLASAIEHPNVCAIYEVGESDNEAYIVMQYVPGQSLDRLIARGPASLQLVLSVGIQVADGLQAAHALGIFHRDLKPQNVMLTDGGLAKILDFGLARRLQPEDAHFVDAADVGMLNRRRQARFAQHRGPHLFHRERSGAKNLEYHWALKLRVVGQIHHATSSGAQAASYLIMFYRLARHSCPKSNGSSIRNV